MEDLYKQVIAKQAQQIGNLTTSVIELDFRLVQALQTVAALEKQLEKESDKDGNDSAESTGSK